MYRFSAGLADRRPDGSQNSGCAKFEFSRQKLHYQPVGGGLERPCTDFQPDRPIGGRMAAKILVAPNLNFPAKNMATIGWGVAWRGHVPIFGQIGLLGAEQCLFK